MPHHPTPSVPQPAGPDRRRLLQGLGLLLAGGGLEGAPPHAAAAQEAKRVTTHPSVTIRAGQLRAELYLPDPARGYYRGTRFDHSGILYSLQYAGHEYYGPWYDRTDPAVRDFTYQGTEIVAGLCSSIPGPVDEFSTRGAGLGFAEAKLGGTFLKIGVGVLRKSADRFDVFTPAEVVDPGRWEVESGSASVRFLHTVTDPGSGHGYRYRKTVRLREDRPELVLEHTLENTGKQLLETDTYNHNFLVLDRRPTGAEFEIRAPFPVVPVQPRNGELLDVQGSRIRFRKQFEGQDTIYTTLQGYGDTAAAYDFHLENRKVNAGVRITGDRPLVRLALWGIRSTLCLEPFVRLAIEPGREARWNYTYRYYTLPAGGG